MALAKRTQTALTNEQRATLVATLRRGLITDWVQTQLIACQRYRQAAPSNWLLSNCLGHHVAQRAAMARFLDGCLVANPQGLGHG